ncbi:MAG TPA: M28 family peptidase [Anaerolineales bacterium]
MNPKLTILFSITVLLLTACSSAPVPQVTYDPASLRFDGQQAYEIEKEFVGGFPNRASGMPNSRPATEWLEDQFSSYGWSCRIDEWEVINYSRRVPMRNVVCTLPGSSAQEILVVAHHDQSPATIEGADNDGSGIAVLLHLSQIFSSEGQPAYTLVFVATDGEEYGMLGSRRYIQTHPDKGKIIAGISLDNLGKRFYRGLNFEAIGQFRKFGALWLQQRAVAAARAAGDLWVPQIRSPIDQLIGQAVPISFMDQGPMVAAGVPALGYTGTVPPEYAALHWDTYHTPKDLMAYQSPDTLYRSGRAAEALIRQLLSMKTFPRESGPYIYFESSDQVLRGLPLWTMFVGFVSLFLLGSYLTGDRSLREKLRGWRGALPHFLGLWLPLVGAILLLYLFVAIGLMDRYEVYPATAKDPATIIPRWPAVILFLLGTSGFFALGRRLVRLYGRARPAPTPASIKSFAMFAIGLAAFYVLVINPFSLLFFVPLLFWYLIGIRKGAGRVLDILFFLLGGLVVYALFYFFGFVIQRMGFAVLWYMMMMFSIGEVGPLTAVTIAVTLAAGLSMVVHPPVRAQVEMPAIISSNAAPGPAGKLQTR